MHLLTRIHGVDIYIVSVEVQLIRGSGYAEADYILYDDYCSPCDVQRNILVYYF